MSATIALGFVGYAAGIARAAEDAAAAAARARQDVVKSLSMEYKRTEVLAKGSESESQAEPLRPKTEIPDKEMTLESTNHLAIDGIKVRLEDNHPTWQMPQGTLLQTRQVAVCDGSLAKRFFSEGLRKDGSPVGYILKDPRLSYVKSMNLTPITLTIRGFQPAIDPLPMGDMKPSGVAVPIAGANCQEYVIDYGNGTTTTCWFDADKDYVVRRMRSQKRGHLSDQTDVTSYRHEEWGWIPTAWVCNQYSSGGATLRTNTVEVLELHVNEPEPSAEFELQFPPGTIVADARNGKYYHVQSDETMREFSASGDSELPWPVLQPEAPWYQRHKWLSAVVAVLLVGIVVSYLIRRMRARAR